MPVVEVEEQQQHHAKDHVETVPERKQRPIARHSRGHPVANARFFGVLYFGIGGGSRSCLCLILMTLGFSAH